VGGRRGTKTTSVTSASVTLPDLSLVKAFRTCSNVHISEGAQVSAGNNMTPSMLAGRLMHPIWDIAKAQSGGFISQI
jgi:hypothetical protein